MKIRSLLLGSVAAAGLSTAGFAADLGVVTSLDICDELGLSGLTISSDDNCLVITGGVTFEYNIGDYDPPDVYTTFNRTGNFYEVDDNDGLLDSSADVDAWLKFVATANSDFGPATATIKLISEDNTGASDWTVGIDEAWVGIGDTTMLMAGYKGSIFNDGDDAPLNYLGLFNSSDVDAGVGFSVANARGGDVIQVGFLASAYRRSLEEDPASPETAASRKRLRELVGKRLKDRVARRGLAVPVDDATSREVVRRELDLHSVAKEDADAIAPHLPRRVRKRLVAVVEGDAEHSIPQRLDDLAFHLDLLFLDGNDASPTNYWMGATFVASGPF